MDLTCNFFFLRLMTATTRRASTTTTNVTAASQARPITHSRDEVAGRRFFFAAGSNCFACYPFEQQPTIIDRKNRNKKLHHIGHLYRRMCHQCKQPTLSCCHNVLSETTTPTIPGRHKTKKGIFLMSDFRSFRTLAIRQPAQELPPHHPVRYTNARTPSTYESCHQQHHQPPQPLPRGDSGGFLTNLSLQTHIHN
jgi:hypothetical protein